jgi:hypothetical protein
MVKIEVVTNESKSIKSIDFLSFQVKNLRKIRNKIESRKVKIKRLCE